MGTKKKSRSTSQFNADSTSALLEIPFARELPRRTTHSPAPIPPCSNTIENDGGDAGQSAELVICGEISLVSDEQGVGTHLSSTEDDNPPTQAPPIGPSNSRIDPSLAELEHPRRPSRRRKERTPSPEQFMCADCEQKIENRDELVACNGPGCDQKFHLACRGLLEKVKGGWFCDDVCRESAGFRVRKRRREAH
ncbi:hypothetical protein FPV67DRAFT_82430 [Lyophyllum atratum]|nr:hypothetical protein FPV67DRAFT_1723594 [Lyophyllum atratum]KAF8078859.1 hypothetical protein FPV67DRAFT_82430 [Lyophyllum atratum]